MSAGASEEQRGLAPVTPLRPRRRRFLAQWPITIVLLVMLTAITFVALDEFRIGSILLSVGVLLAFALRAVLPTSRVGLLAVRSRTVDLIVLGGLGAGLLIFALWVPPPA